MKAKLPFIGEVRTGADSAPEIVERKVEVKEKAGMFGGLFDWKKRGALTTESAVSDKLLKSNQGWVYRNNDVIAKAVSELDPQLFKMVVRGGQVEFDEIEDHPILDLLDRFNDSLSRTEGFYLTQSHVKLAGDAFWLLMPGADGLPEQIFLLQPDKVKLKLGDFTDSNKALIEAFIYEDQITEGGKTKKVKETYDPEQIIQFKVPNPANPYRGKSAVEAAVNEIDTDTLSIETLRNFFANGAIIDFVLSTPERVTSEQRQVLQREMRANYGGVRNAFKTLILGGGLKPERMQFSNKEMELMQLQEWFRDKIMVLFGNTKASLGIIDDVNRASHESSIISWRQDSIVPEMARMVNTLNEYLLPKFGEDLILGFKDPIPENRDAKVKEAVELIKEDIISQNEAREILGLDTVAGGDSFKRDRAPALPPALKHVDVKKHLRTVGFTKKVARGREVYKASRNVAEKWVKSRKAEPVTTVREHEQLSNDQVWAYYEKQIKVTEIIEERVRQQLDTFLKELIEEAVGNMQNAIGTKAAGDPLIDAVQAEINAQSVFGPLLAEVMLSAGNQAADLVDFDDPFTMTDELRKYVFDQVQRFTGSMVETDQKVLADVIVDGIRDGKSVPQIERSMREVFAEYSKSQTERIVRTEVLRASNHAALQAFEDSGVVVAKQWLTAEDERVCPYCEPMNGKTLPLSENYFNLGDEWFGKADKAIQIDYTAIEAGNLHVSCRCVILPVVEGAKGFDASKVYEMRDLRAKVFELETKLGDMDKRTKEAKLLKAEQDGYIKALESFVYE